MRTRQVVLHAMVGLTVSFATLLVGPAARAEWGTYQANAAHTGYVPGRYDTSNTKLLWQTQVGSTAPIGLAVGGNTVFVSSKEYFTDKPTFHALDQASGSILWSKTFIDNSSTSAPAYANGVVYFQTDGHSSINGNFVHAYTARTGASVFDAPYAAQWETYLNPTPYGGNVYVGGGYYGGMYSFNATSGTQNWFGSVPQYDGWTPAIDGKYAYAYTGSGSTSPVKGVFTMLNLVTGTTAYRFVDPTYDWRGYTMDSAVVLGKNQNAFTINGGRLVSWDTMLDATHTPHIGWSRVSGFTGQPSLANGNLFVISNGSLAVLDELTGNTLWGWTAPTGSLLGPMIVTDDLLFAQTGSTTYAISLTSRSSVWSYGVSGPMALSDGRLYVGANDKSLYAFAVPEPACLSLLLMGAARALRRRR